MFSALDICSVACNFDCVHIATDCCCTLTFGFHGGFILHMSLLTSVLVCTLPIISRFRMTLYTKVWDSINCSKKFLGNFSPRWRERYSLCALSMNTRKVYGNVGL